jgi:hypothetical protein
MRIAARDLPPRSWYRTTLSSERTVGRPRREERDTRAHEEIGGGGVNKSGGARESLCEKSATHERDIALTFSHGTRANRCQLAN